MGVRDGRTPRCRPAHRIEHVKGRWIGSPGLATVFVVTLGLGGCGWASLPSGATSQAELMHRDWTVFTIAGLCVFAIVGGLIVGSPFVWRRRGEALPPQFRRNVPIEIITTVIPLIMIALLFVLTYRVESVVERLSPSPSTIVDVVGFRWSWRFQYSGTSVQVIGTPKQPPEMVIPLGRTTRINLESADVNHAFWVPGFLFKRDAIPGVHNSFDWHPDHLGVFVGRCAEFCGLEHAFMTFAVRVVPPDEFERWLRQHETRPTAYRQGPR